jgi:threonyl-tRNA synthetase
MILPISEKFAEYAEKVRQMLELEDIRGIVDHRDEKIGRKIRDAEVKKLPYMLIVGEKESETETVSVRRHGSGDQGSSGIAEFVAEFKKAMQESLGK